jgi:hypothetical protein
MPRYFVVLALLAISVIGAACGTSTALERQASRIHRPECEAHADVTEVGNPARVRLWAENTGDVPIVKWSWRIDGQWYDAPMPDGVYWLQLDHPGNVNALLRGVDGKGHDCSSPIKIRSRERYNSAPVVLFDGPQDFGEHSATQDDGTVLRYHEWRWDISRSYDPETSIATFEWGIYGGGDLDGDGIPDTLYAGKTVDGAEFSKLPGLIVKHIDDQQQFILWVTPELTDGTLRMAVTATDNAAKPRPRRWGDGHVTLMK